MSRTALMLRCFPRYGYDNTEVRTIDLDVSRQADLPVVERAVSIFFAARGIDEAVYDVGIDADGFYAIINDEAFAAAWGTPLL